MASTFKLKLPRATPYSSTGHITMSVMGDLVYLVCLSAALFLSDCRRYRHQLDVTSSPTALRRHGFLGLYDPAATVGSSSAPVGSHADGLSSSSSSSISAAAGLIMPSGAAGGSGINSQWKAYRRQVYTLLVEGLFASIFYARGPCSRQVQVTFDCTIMVIHCRIN